MGVTSSAGVITQTDAQVYIAMRKVFPKVVTICDAATGMVRSPLVDRNETVVEEERDGLFLGLEHGCVVQDAHADAS